MRYMLLIYGNEAADAARTEQEQKEIFDAYMVYTQEIQEKGVMVSGEPLLPTSTATTVRVRNGKKTTTHGPFAETAEQLGGYYVIQCENLDEALEWAARLPSSATGSVEVRPVMDM